MKLSQMDKVAELIKTRKQLAAVIGDMLNPMARITLVTRSKVIANRLDVNDTLTTTAILGGLYKRISTIDDELVTLGVDPNN